MRKWWVLLLAAVLVLAGCAEASVSKQTAVMVAAGPGVERLSIAGISYVDSADPVAEVQSGKAAFALIEGAAPAGLESLTLRADEQVLMQGWLDQPLAVTLAEARQKVAAAPDAASSTPKAGVVARGRLSELAPGWRAVPVAGVIPSPETLANGTYPLVERLTLAWRGTPDQAVLSQFKAAVRPAGAPWISLSVTGDFMLARGVDRAMRENGTLYPIAKVADHLSKADLTFVNLESPIGVKGNALPGKQIWFRARPEAMEILKAAGVDGVTVANNHILDYDTDNFLETLDALKQAGIKSVGGGRNITEARQPMVLESKGVKIAFLGYSQFADLFFDWNYPRSFSATDTLAGVPRIQDDWLAADIKAAKALAPIVAVAYHWGDEFQNYPNEMQKQVAHRTIDLGADLVLGYHPHAIQGFELYKGKFVAYSTGNFIMDRQDTDLARESMILDFAVAPDGVKAVNVLPVWIKAEQPYIMTGQEGEQLMQKIRSISNWQ